MKKIIYLIVFIAMVLVTSCEDKLDTVNLYGKSIENFYKTPTDIDQAMAGVYNGLFVGSPHGDEPIAANILDNMMFGGGGTDDVKARDADNFQDPGENTYLGTWLSSYNGISRANGIIEGADAVDFSPYFDTPEEALNFKDQAIGEAYFMRAFYFFRLAKFFGGVPLIVKLDTPRDIPRNTYTETYAQIASDLVTAIEKMPAESFPSTPTSKYGRANKWVAEAYLARVYLYYTGYMTNIEGQATSELPLVDGGSLSASDVSYYLDDCIQNSGYELASDFRNLWPYSYVNTVAGTDVLPWAANEGLSWVGQDGHSPTFGTGNYESMFVQRFSFANWSSGDKYQNKLCLYSGFRENVSLTPFGQGWGWMPVNPTIKDTWDDEDPRKEGSILAVGEADQGTAEFKFVNGVQQTGLVNKKYIGLQNVPQGGGNISGMFIQMYDWKGDQTFMLMNAQDFIFMRFADVLLMHSEITETADGMNRVRQRAGLGSVGYSLDALKEERLHEFAFEGLHWFDLVRWGDVNTAFDQTIQVNNGGDVGSYKVTYRPETKGLVPIPEKEIRLSNGVYEQNPGW